MAGQTVISVDLMGGDSGPAPFIAGLQRVARRNPSLRFILHGDEARVAPALRRARGLSDRVEIRHAPDTVAMEDKPSRVLRTGRNSSMWHALHSVKQGEARVAISAGNTGALMAMSMLALRKAPAVDRPAIAVYWPRIEAGRFNVVLDVGADIRASARNLVEFAVMGAAYARVSFGLDRPRVGLLNVGSEDIKGSPELHEAAEFLTRLGREADFTFVGFVEGNDIPSDKADVIVTDGFSGNIALKSAEGTASLIRTALREAFTFSPLSRIGALFARGSLSRLRKRIDPRRVNGGVFLGLNGAVVKSHGGADALGFASAVELAAKMADTDFPALVAAQLAKHRTARLTHQPGASEAKENHE